MNETNPNSFDKEIEDANANPQATDDKGTEPKENAITDLPKEDDYRVKFVESAKEAQRLFNEGKVKDELIAKLQSQGIQTRPDATDDLIPGFSELDEAEQDRLIAYTNMVKKQTLDSVYQDPAIAYAKTTYNSNKFNESLSLVVAEFPDLAENKSEFKAMYYNPSSVPDNITDILRDMAKVYLFDKAKDIGRAEAKDQEDRVQLENTTGGDRAPSARRSLADWNEIAKNPAKFAAMSKEYQADLDSGLLKE